MKGTKIHASRKKTYWDKIAKKVHVGMWRNIENFSVTNPGATYRPTNHQYKLNFIYGTDVTPSTLQNDIMILSLVDFQTIQQGVEDENIFIGKYDNFKFSKFITSFPFFFPTCRCYWRSHGFGRS